MKWIYKIHQWVSLACAIFLLVLCVTGLPLIFRHEIAAWNSVDHAVSCPLPNVALWDGMADGMDMVAQQYPQKMVRAISANAEQGTLFFRVQDKGRLQLTKGRMRMGGEQLIYNVANHSLVNRDQREVRFPLIAACMRDLHLLHVQLGLGRIGRSLLGVMCLLGLAAILSGLWLYGPFMQNKAFGDIQKGSWRSCCSDWHKFISIPVFAWAFLLCLSGAMIVLYSLSYDSYMREAQADAIAHFSHRMAGSSAEPLSIALEKVQEQYSEQVVQSVELPIEDGDMYRFYLAPRYEKLDYFMAPQLVFLPAEGGEFFQAPQPWYLPLASVFLNLHIHNHGTVLLRILWSAYGLFMIGMVASGIALWFTRWYNRVYPKRIVSLRKPEENMWRLPCYCGVLSLIGLIAPLYGALGEAVGAAALLLPFFLLWEQQRRSRL